MVQTYTSHERILVAKVREYDYSTACGVCGSLLSLSQAVDIPSAVLLMKRTVPEFKSKNSPYEQYDLRIEQERQAAGQLPDEEKARLSRDLMSEVRRSRLEKLQTDVRDTDLSEDEIRAEVEYVRQTMYMERRGDEDYSGYKSVD